MKTPTCLLFAALAAALIAKGPCSMAATETIVLSNEHARIEIGPDGRCQSFREKASGEDLCEKNEPVLHVFAKRGELAISSCRLSGERLSFELDGGAQAVVRVRSLARHFLWEVESAEGDGIDHIVFASFRLKPSAPNALATCMLALNVDTNVPELPRANERLRAYAHAKLGLNRGAAALIACPPDQLRSAMQDVVSAAPELPHSPIGGPWALDAEINRGSYVFNFGGLSEQTADDWIALAKALGFNQIDFHGGGSFRFGDCRPNPATYPNGRASLKAVVDRLHAAGIKAGLHTYAFFIAKDCPWVTPVPDPRLAKDAFFTLDADISAEADFVPTQEPTTSMSAITGFFVRNSVTLQIDDELITYNGVSKEAPFAFTGCKRGAYGTKPAAHAKGARVAHLKECFGLFVPDPETTLFGEVAAATADTFNECGFDMIYLDALDGEDTLGGGEWGWHYGSKFVFEIWKRLQRPALQEMSTFHHHLWFVRSRMGAWDHPTRSHKKFIDLHVAANQSNRKMILPGELGWWAVKTWGGAQTEPTFFDDIEYLCCKAIGTGDGLALMGVDPSNIKSNPTLSRLSAIFKSFEELRHAGHFSEAVRKQMAKPDTEFTLSALSDGTPAVRPVRYVRHKFTGADEVRRTDAVHPHRGSDVQRPVRLVRGSRAGGLRRQGSVGAAHCGGWRDGSALGEPAGCARR